MKKVLISVITVCYNSQATIKDTIESVLHQSYNNIEYIIVDGLSSDDTINIVKSYEEKFIAKGISYAWTSEKDSGIYDAMNKGISLAKGELIGILNSDDWYTNSAISTIVKKNKNRQFSIISGQKNKVNFKKEILKTLQNKKEIQKNIYKTMPVNHPATFVHKTVYETIGLFDTQYKLSADYDLIYRAFNAGAQFLFTDKILVNMRNTGETHQTKNLFITAKEDHHIRKKNKVKWTSFYYLKRIGFNYLVIIRDYFRGKSMVEN
jgi:glycosyltransferase involved in cell wall biosynthesis